MTTKLNVYKIKVEFVDRMSNPAEFKSQIFLSTSSECEENQHDAYTRTNLGKVGVLNVEAVQEFAFKSPDRLLVGVNPDSTGIVELKDGYVLAFHPDTEGVDLKNINAQRFNTK